MPVQALVGHAQEALVLALLLSLPVLVVAALVGLLVGALQGATQIQDGSVGHLPKVVAGGLVLVLAAPWMGHHLLAFASRMLGLAGS